MASELKPPVIPSGEPDKRAFGAGYAEKVDAAIASLAETMLDAFMPSGIDREGLRQHIVRGLEAFCYPSWRMMPVKEDGHE